MVAGSALVALLGFWQGYLTRKSITRKSIFIGERRGKVIMMSDRDFARENALDVLEQHGIRAQFYIPAAHVQDRDLADALRLLTGRGYIMTDRDGKLVGVVVTARQTTEENAQMRRAEFKVIENQ